MNKITTIPYYEIRLYIGNREGYHGDKFGKRHIMNAVKLYQKERNELVTLRYTKCTYQYGEWDENGWEIASIDYPKFPKGEAFLRSWFIGLAEFLIINLKQHRMTLCDPQGSTTIEREEI